jgi:hypothetical protein
MSHWMDEQTVQDAGSTNERFVRSGVGQKPKSNIDAVILEVGIVGVDVDKRGTASLKIRWWGRCRQHVAVLVLSELGLTKLPGMMGCSSLCLALTTTSAVQSFDPMLDCMRQVILRQLDIAQAESPRQGIDRIWPWDEANRRLNLTNARPKNSRLGTYGGEPFVRGLGTKGNISSRYRQVNL